MSVEKVREYLKQYGVEDRMQEFKALASPRPSALRYMKTPF